MVKLISWYKNEIMFDCFLCWYLFVCGLYMLIVLLYLQIEIKEADGVCPSPSDMAGQVVTYLEEKGFLHE